jgi:hypothetical protein
LIWVFGASAWACDDVGTEARAARDLLLMMERDQAGAALERARAALSCDLVDPTELAVLYLMEAAFRTFDGDDAGARGLFAAAGRVAPDVWLVDLGPELQETYRQAKLDPVPDGALSWEGVPDGAEVRVDGAPAPGRRVEGGGVRTLQVVRAGAVVFGATQLVEGDVTVQVAPAPPPVAPAPAPSAPRPEGRWALHLATGGELVLGQPVTAGTRDERGTRAAASLEVGARLRLGPTFWRPTVGVGQSLGSPLLYAAGDEVRATTTVVTAGLTGGVVLGRAAVGLQGGAWLPGRQSLRAVAGGRIAGPLWAEARLGAHRVAGRPLEPVGSVWVVVAPTLR